MGMYNESRGIRLRPLEIGDVLDETFRVYKSNFVPIVTVMAIAIIPAALIMLIAAVLTGVGAGLGQSTFNNLSPEAGMALLGAGLLAALVIIVLGIASGVAQLIATGAVVRVISNAILGQPIDIRDAYRESLGRFWRLTGAGLCVGLAVAGLLVTCIGIPVAVFVGLGWSLAYQAIMLEGHGIFDAMRRSWALVDGHRWRLLVISILIGIISYLLMAIPGGIIALLAGGLVLATGASTSVQLVLQAVETIFQAAGQALFTPISLITATLIYYDLRIRKEAFDLQQRMPGGYNPQQPGYPQYPPQYPQYPQAPQYPPQNPQYPQGQQYPPQYPPQYPQQPPQYPQQPPQYPPQYPQQQPQYPPPPSNPPQR